ncbi:MAG: hypothetical protein V3V48_06290 [Candidatus Aminicenantaceae bacterium]
MKDKPEQETHQSKKPYKKPELKKVALKPDEAVLGYCKSDNKRGPGIGVCDSPTRCYVIGS